MQAIKNFLTAPVIGADGQPFHLDSGKVVTLWDAIWRAAVGTATIIIGINVLYLAFAIAAVLDNY